MALGINNNSYPHKGIQWGIATIAGLTGSFISTRSVAWLANLCQEAGWDKMLTPPGLLAIGGAALHVIAGLSTAYLAHKYTPLLAEKARLIAENNSLKEEIEDLDPTYDPNNDSEEERYNPLLEQRETNSLRKALQKMPDLGSKLERWAVSAGLKICKPTPGSNKAAQNQGPILFMEDPRYNGG